MPIRLSDIPDNEADQPRHGIRLSDIPDTPQSSPIQTLLEILKPDLVPGTSTLAKSGGLPTVFRALSTPGAMVRSGLRAGATGQPIGPAVGEAMRSPESVAPFTQTFVGGVQRGAPPSNPYVGGLQEFLLSTAEAGAGMAADVATDPVTYLTAGLSRVPQVQSLGKGLVASPLGQAVSKTLQKPVGQVAEEMVQPIRKVGAGIQRGASSVGRVPGNALEFLRGNPKAIEVAENQLKESAHQSALNFRRGGAYNTQLREAMHMRSRESWEPMKQLGRTIQTPTEIGELRTLASVRYADDPEILAEVNVILDNIQKGYKKSAFLGDELVEVFTDLGENIRNSAKAGQSAKDSGDYILSNVRSLIGEILEKKAPDNLKGAFSLANQQWAKYATDRNQIYKYFKPGAQPELVHESGEKLLHRVATGSASPGETEFVGRLSSMLGTDLSKVLEKQALKLQRAKTIGTMGNYTRRALKTGGVLGAGKILLD